MERKWSDFKSLKGDYAGAREAFENACEELFRKVYPDKHVSIMKVRQGDGGIDIFIGDFGVEPIVVVQCKFFLEDFGDSQKQQIRDSFNTANTSDKFEVKEWILCLPYVFDINENSWFFTWKEKQTNILNKDGDFIKLKNGNELIALMKQHNIYNQIFEIEDSQNILKILNILEPKVTELYIDPNLNNILFNNYTEKCKDFYQERNIDNFFLNNLKLNNIWVFGKSGNGKTAYVSRNLSYHKMQFCYCDLSPLTIEEADQVFNEIISNIEVKFSLTRNYTEENHLKQISDMLYKHNHSDVVIVIDELSISNQELIKQIIDQLTKLVIYHSKRNVDGNLKFIFSTIHDPKLLSDNYPKASEYFQFICCDDWESDILNLFDLLNTSLNFELNEFKQDIVEASCNSPRVLKAIFRKLTLLEEINRENLSNIIKIVKSEIVH